MKPYFSLKNTPNSEDDSQLGDKEALKSDILKTQYALELAYQGFDYALDPDLIDCYIYEVNSALKRYRFLINQAQRMHLFVPEVENQESNSIMLNNLSLNQN